MTKLPSRVYFIYRGIGPQDPEASLHTTDLSCEQLHLQNVSSLHLLGWCATLEQARDFAQHFHDAKYCGKRNFAYLINAYTFPFVVSQRPQYHQREFEALASYVATPTPKNTALIWQEAPKGIRISTSMR